MHADPEMLTAVVVALVGGLTVFAVLLLAGVALVRALGLPQELPDGPRFEPPPPPLRAHGERSGALQAAARQAAVTALYARARELEFQERECQALAGPHSGREAEAGAALLAPQLQAASAASAAAQAALLAFDRRQRAAPAADAGQGELAAALAQGEPVVQGALAAARALAPGGAPAGPSRRRLLLLSGFLLLWLAALAAVLWR